MTFLLGDPTQTETEIHVGDFGTQFIVTVYNQYEVIQNLSTATLLGINFLTPSRETKAKTASLYTDGTDGKIIYTLENGDMDEAGLWSYQAIVEFPAGSWSTNIVKFTVYPNIPEPVVP